ncbi:methylated-DNA--[protein]-cysteine S-methyltransferase [Fangia hongkongensis]|uniref:methylated-DNA--[protein]-cysteine S-methyltransferase n=1 Tax=Fangia hongkongensis TaxID=270495 RepID=UPI00036490D2|nr:methylated-DNA--[protein]-cysteine S-methyltransferase [Fangia hongkongensis]MBK2123968.1 methylated-DNA--[protein]-cysteine S-methyltransferase [Fangia hongkongensis]
MLNAVAYDQSVIHTPVGFLRLVADDQHLLRCDWSSDQKNDTDSRETHSKIIRETIKQLTAYFDRKSSQFDLPISLEGTHFQKCVWQALQNIPFGQTISYKTLAKNVDNPKALRAVGSANGKNPISIIVPCHRVIRESGNIGGYGGGLKAKRTLLALEGINL